MADLADRAQEAAEHQQSLRRHEPYELPPRLPGICVDCGEWSGHLVLGVCLSCSHDEPRRAFGSY